MPAVCRYPGEIELSSAVTRCSGGFSGWPTTCETRLRVAAAKREREHHGRLRGDRIRLQPLEHARVEVCAARLRRIAPAAASAHGDQLGGAEAGIDGRSREKLVSIRPAPISSTSASATCADDHHVAHAGARRAGAAAVLEIGIQLGPRRLQRGRQAEQHADHDRGGEAQTARRASRARHRPDAAGSRARGEPAAAASTARRASRARRRRARARRFRSAAAAQAGRGRRRAPCAPRARGAAPRRARSAGPATFAHAISSTNPTAPSSTSIAVRTSATMLVASGSPSSDVAGVAGDVARADPVADRLAAVRCASLSCAVAATRADRAEVMHVARVVAASIAERRGRHVERRQHPDIALLRMPHPMPGRRR